MQIIVAIENEIQFQVCRTANIIGLCEVKGCHANRHTGLNVLPEEKCKGKKKVQPTSIGTTKKQP